MGSTKTFLWGGHPQPNRVRVGDEIYQHFMLCELACALGTTLKHTQRNYAVLTCEASVYRTRIQDFGMYLLLIG
jgi:hypothetical protein